MIDLNLGQLQAFRSVIELGSFEEAARSLHVTPSAVSQRIKALEIAAGRVLVSRTKPAQATESGETILLLARQVDLAAQEAVRRLGGEFGDGGEARDPGGARPANVLPLVPLAVNADSLATWVMPALTEVSSVARIEVHREDEDRTIDLLRQGKVVAAITSLAAPVPGCGSTYLGKMRYVPMATRKFIDLWFKDGVNAEALARAPCVAFDRTDKLQERYIKRRTRRNLDPPIHFIPSTSEYASAVQLGLGWGLIPEIQHLPRRTELVNFDPQFPTDVKLYLQRWRLPSARLDEVAAAISQTASQWLSNPAQKRPI